MRQQTAAQRAERFIREATQFRLGGLVTEQPHPITKELSQTAERSISEALRLLFEADGDVVRKYREWAESDSPGQIRDEVVSRLMNGGKVFFTGCGSTGRLSIQMDSIWRDFWQKMKMPEWEDRTRSVMAGGDFALIKSVEGFEDYTQFGAQQIEDLGVSEKDVVFAITEGGETSFVIGTAWKALEKGAKVYFVYNNPDEVLREQVVRSREVIDDPRIEKINLTTGPMSITGSTRMQATSIQLCVLLTVFEDVVGSLVESLKSKVESDCRYPSDDSYTPHPDLLPLREKGIPHGFLEALEEVHAVLLSDEVRKQLAGIVEMEERVYRSGHKNTYFADKLAIDVLTDTTERSPTYCVPAFRKFNDTLASESWSFLFLPYEDSRVAWERLLKRQIQAVSWSRNDVASLIGEENANRQHEIVRGIGKNEIHRFRIGLDGLEYRVTGEGDSATAIVTDEELSQLTDDGGFYRTILEKTKVAGASTGLIFLGGGEAVEKARRFVVQAGFIDRAVFISLPETGFMLDGIKRITAKLLLNALSTCTMVRMGRVLGNFMIYVVPSNLKLIDRSTRYISHLTGLSYEDSCKLLFEVIEYVEPRMKQGLEYPSPVGLAVLRAREGLTNEDAEKRLAAH